MTPSARLGYTLVEMAISMVVLAIILLGAQSAVMVTAKAMPDGRSTASRVIGASNVLDVLANELSYAISVPTMNVNSVAFTVADRNNDGSAESIRYDWSGVAGAALFRTYNGGTAVAVAANVKQFSLAYDKRAKTLPTTYSEGSEFFADSHDASSGLSDASVTSSTWRASYLMPNVPNNAVSWRVTRAWIQVRKESSSTGVTKIQLRPALNGAPSSVVLAETTLMESSLSSNYQWWEIAFPNCPNLGPSTALCLVLQYVSGSESCEVRYRNYLLGSPQNYMLTGSGSSWSASNNCLQYYLAGIATTPNPATFSYELTGVRCTLMAGDTAASLNTTVRILNEPVVAGP